MVTCKLWCNSQPRPVSAPYIHFSTSSLSLCLAFMISLCSSLRLVVRYKPAQKLNRTPALHVVRVAGQSCAVDRQMITPARLTLVCVGSRDAAAGSMCRAYSPHLGLRRCARGQVGIVHDADAPARGNPDEFTFQHPFLWLLHTYGRCCNWTRRPCRYLVVTHVNRLPVQLSHVRMPSCRCSCHARTLTGCLQLSCTHTDRLLAAVMHAH